MRAHNRNIRHVLIGATAFFNYFQEQNAKIESGDMDGYPLNFATLGIGNGIIDEAVQAEWYPEFAVNNTYGRHCDVQTCS